mmetsp:Transcript_30822/g.66153  ORF Transcript_30822/g.66153 Transcript_30822/m.66153 type:complete len:216 (+) Transcript_30822:701-1348(+)
MAAAAWSRPVMPVSLPPGQTPKMVPTEKLVSTMEDPSSGSKATEKPSPPMGKGSGTSSLHASSQTPENLSVSNKILSASRSTASCSSPKELMQAVALHDAVRTLYAMVRTASPMLSMSCLSFKSSVLFSRNSSSVSPTSALAASLVLLLACLVAWAMLIPCLPLKADLAEPSGADLRDAAAVPAVRATLPVVAALRVAPCTLFAILVFIFVPKLT